MKDEKRKIISDICPLYKEYGTCEQCNIELDIDGEPCYFECMANHIIRCGYSKQSKGEWIILSEDDNPWDSVWKCSRCGAITSTEEPTYKNYCPVCGAKMKGGKE